MDESTTPRGAGRLRRAGQRAATALAAVLMVVLVAPTAFAATGVTDGSLLDGVHFRGDFAETETVVLRSKTGTVRRIKTTFRMLGMKAVP